MSQFIRPTKLPDNFMYVAVMGNRWNFQTVRRAFEFSLGFDDGNIEIAGESQNAVGTFTGFARGFFAGDDYSAIGECPLLGYRMGIVIPTGGQELWLDVFAAGIRFVQCKPGGLVIWIFDAHFPMNAPVAFANPAKLPTKAVTRQERSGGTAGRTHLISLRIAGILETVTLVAQDGILLYRRMAFGRGIEFPKRGHILPTANG